MVVGNPQGIRKRRCGSWLGTGTTRLNVPTADDRQGEKGMEAGVALNLYRLSYRRGKWLCFSHIDQPWR